MTTKNTACKTVLLSDSPAKTDAFTLEQEVGPHLRTARAISDLIHSEAGGKAIGIEGDWGSGKSTVVNLLQTELQISQPDKVLTIVFDAWAHEGDPLRRSFLETVINEAIGKKWLEQATWKREIEILSKRLKESETKTYAKPTSLGGLFALSTALIPAGVACLSKALEHKILWFELSHAINWKFIAGLLAFGPLFVAAGNLIYLWIKRKSICDRRNWAFLDSKAATSVKAQSSETPDPTSIEFESCFNRAIEAAIGSDNSKKVVIIVDNLDRVEEASAKQIWSTLQTFLHHKEPGFDWGKRIWIVVPYAPSAIEALWRNEPSKKYAKLTSPVSIDQSATDGASVLSQSHLQKNETEMVCASFLEKSFQIRFSVSPPVLSDWRDYLITLISTALPSHSDTEAHQIYRVYNQFMVKNGGLPTPRQLKSFVNQIGAIHRQWGDAFPLDHVAYFVIECKERATFIKQLIDGSQPLPASELLFDAHLKESLAALAFNVKAEKGLELLLSQPILSALEDESGQRLISLRERHRRGFWLVLEQTISDGRFFASSICSMALSLNASKLFSGALERSENRVKDEFLKKAKEIREWPNLDEKVPVALQALFEIHDSQDFVLHIVDSLRQSTFAGNKNETDPTISERAIVAIIKTLQIPAVTRISFPSSSKFNIPNITAASWAICCAAAIENDRVGIYWKHIRPRLSAVEISSGLTASVSTGRFEPRDLSAVMVSKEIFPEINWDSFISVSNSHLSINNAPKPETIGHLLLALFHLSRNGNEAAENCLRSLANDGHILHQLYEAKNQSNFSAVAACMYCYLHFFPDNKRRTASGNSDHGLDIITSALRDDDENLSSSLSSMIVQLADVKWIIDVTRSHNGYPKLMCSTLSKLASQKENHALVPVSLAVSHWPIIRQLLSGSENTLLHSLAEETNLCETLRKDGFNPDKSILYRDICLIRDSSNSSSLLDWCAAELEVLSTDTWLYDLKNGQVLCWLVSTLYGMNRQPSLGPRFVDALAAHAKISMQATVSVNGELKDSWGSLIHCIRNEATIGEFFSQTLAEVANLDGAINDTFFELYSPSISLEVLTKHHSFPLQRIIVPIIRRSSSLRGVAWVLNILKGRDNCRSLFREGNDAFDNLIERISMTLKRDDLTNETKEVVLALSEHLNPNDATSDKGTDTNNSN